MKNKGNGVQIPKTIGAPRAGEDLLGDGDDEDDLDAQGAGQDDDYNDDELGGSDDEGDLFDEDSSATDIAELRGQVTALTGTVSSLLQRGDQTNRQVAAAAGLPDLNLDGLPDPVTKRAEFNQELSTRLTKYMGEARAELQNQATTTNQQVAQQQQVAALDSRFRNEYPDLAKRPALLESTVAVIARELAARGRNIQTVMTSSPDKFLRTVANRMKSELGMTDDRTAEGRRQMRRPGAAKGMAGGSRGTGSAGKQQKNEKPLGFVDQIKKQQQAMGIL